MLYPGLVSVTFRMLSPRQIIYLVTKARLSGIEWGGDIHVPHGDLNKAREVRLMTQDAGLIVAAYGSYYWIGDDGDALFKQILDTAAELEAPTIRIWAGRKGSRESDDNYRKKVIDESLKLAELASKMGKTLSYEYHGNTLTDDPDSARRLMEEINHPCIKSYWQPLVHLTWEKRYNGLNAILPWLSNVHLYTWTNTLERLALAAGEREWKPYLQIISSDPADHFILMEFVKNDDPELFLQDAEILRKWLNSVQSEIKLP
jgi:sugar phosphate isomerase/epimerase